MTTKVGDGGYDILQIVDLVFSGPPRPPCSYNIALATKILDEGYNMFHILFNILICGAQKLYGNDISANDITPKQFDTLQLYINSLGYTIKYNYDYNAESVPIKVNIWFELFTSSSNCHTASRNSKK